MGTMFYIVVLLGREHMKVGSVDGGIMWNWL